MKSDLFREASFVHNEGLERAHKSHFKGFNLAVWMMNTDTHTESVKWPRQEDLIALQTDGNATIELQIIKRGKRK